jgi:hypothetical protein
MKRCAPLVKTTAHSSDLREWVPSTFSNYLREVEHLSHFCDGADPILLFRGQVNSDWLLDCKLVRSVLKKEATRRVRSPRPLRFHTKVVDILLAKFEKFRVASQSVCGGAISDGTDAMYELMRRFQQYEEEDKVSPKGTFLVDWTLNQDVALYFATYDGRNNRRRCRQTPGAVWLCDPVATGRVLQIRTVEDLLLLMRDNGFRLKAERTLPLIFHPSRRKPMLRASHQKAVYFSQMNFRYDLADVWCSIEDHGGPSVFRKLILTESLLQDAVQYLESHGIMEEYVYPD